MIKGISIILCTFNGATRLKPTIEHLAEQELCCDAELILVDNASTDGSASLVKEIWDQKGNPYPLVLVNESNPGLIYARTKGLCVARYEVIVFCDDDNWLQHDYLKLTCELFDKIPEAGLVGGLGIGVTDGDFPSGWQDSTFSCNYAVGKQMEQSGFADSRGYLWGAGLAGKKKFLKHIFNDAYPFLMVGRKGNTVLSGDDSEMCLRALLAGSHLYYDERLVYRHFIPATRLTDAYFKHLIDSFNASKEIDEEYRSALFFSQLNKRDKAKQFCVRFGNFILHPTNPRKKVLLRYYLSYSMHLRHFVPDRYKVIFDYCKYSDWGKTTYETDRYYHQSQ